MNNEMIDGYFDTEFNKKPMYACFSKPSGQTARGMGHAFFSTSAFLKFASKEKMEEHIRNNSNVLDTFEYIKYETLPVSVEVKIG